MLFRIFSDILMNCVSFAIMDQVFSLKKKTFKKYWINEQKQYSKSQGILSGRKSGNHVLTEQKCQKH